MEPRASNHDKANDKERDGFGIKYVTPSLLVKYGGVEDVQQLSSLTELDLSFDSSEEHKIVRLEHLDRCKSLRRLLVVQQALQRMTGISALHQLVELDLSGNKLREIECIQHLRRLQKFDVSFNAIVRIPACMSYLCNLRTLNLSRNKIQNIRDVLNLRACTNLQKLQLTHNPIASLSHYHAFTVYHVPQLAMLDAASVTQRDIDDARQRLERDEVDTLLASVQQKDEEIARLKKNVRQLTELQQHSENKLSEFEECVARQKQKMAELETQVATQQQLIRRKNEVINNTRQELMQMEEKYRTLQASFQEHSENSVENKHQQQHENEKSDEKEKEEEEEREVKTVPAEFQQACAVYFDSIECVAEMLSRYDAVRTQHAHEQHNLRVIREQISKTKLALEKLHQRRDIRESVENPFEHAQYSQILSQTPSTSVLQMSLEVSPILSQKQSRPQSQPQPTSPAIAIAMTDEGIRAKISEAHSLDQEIESMERTLQEQSENRKRAVAKQQRTKRRRKSSLSSRGSNGGGDNDDGDGDDAHNGSMAAATTTTASDTASSSDALVQEFAQLIESMDRVESGFSTQQKLWHSHDLDELRTKLVTRYINRYEREHAHVLQCAQNCEREATDLETQLVDYLANRDRLLLDIHRILQQYHDDRMSVHALQFVPPPIAQHALPQSLEQQLVEFQEKFENEQKVNELLRHQIQQRQTMTKEDRGGGGDLVVKQAPQAIAPNSKVVQNLIVRAESAENKVQELSFLNGKLQKELHDTSLSHAHARSPQKLKTKNVKNVSGNWNGNGNEKHAFLDLVNANEKIASLEQMLKDHESELVKTLTQKLKEAETECDRLKKETEEKLSFAKYLMTTKEQRLEAEKTINLTLQREIEDMKLQQSDIMFQEHSENRVENKQQQQAQQPSMKSYTEPQSMQHSLDHQHMFISQPIKNLEQHNQSNISAQLLINDSADGDAHSAGEHDAVRINMDDDDDDDDLVSVHSAQQNILALSQRLDNLKQRVKSEEDTIHVLETRKSDLTQECTRCLQQLNGIQSDIVQCKTKKQEISEKLTEMETEHQASKLQSAQNEQQLATNQEHEETQHIMQQLMQKSQQYSAELAELERKTTQLLQQKEEASSQLNGILAEIEGKQVEYSQIEKRIKVKQFELTSLEQHHEFDTSELQVPEHSENENKQANGVMINQSKKQNSNHENKNEEDDDDDDDETRSFSRHKNVSEDQKTFLRQKREFEQLQQRLPIVCQELESTQQQLKQLKRELRHHQNYHKIIRLNAVETEIEERVKHLQRLKSEIDESRNCQRALNEKLSERTQDLKQMEYDVQHRQEAIENKKSEFDALEQAMQHKQTELNVLQKHLEKKSKKLSKLNGRLSEAEELLKEISNETSTAQSKLGNLHTQVHCKENELASSMELLRRSSSTNDAMKLFKVVEQIETEHKQLLAARNQVQATNQELETVKSEIKTHKNVVAELTQETQELQRVLQSQNEAKQVREQELSALNGKIEELHRNKRRILSDLEMEQSNLEQVRKQLTAQRTEVKRLKKEFQETDENMNETRYKLMSAEDDLSETKQQLSALKSEYDRVKNKLKSASRGGNSSSSSRKMSPKMLTFATAQKSETPSAEQQQRLAVICQELNDKKSELLRYQSEVEHTQQNLTECNKSLKKMKEEQLQISRQIQMDKGKLSVYETEIESQRHALDALYEKKRAKTVELFAEKSAEIQEANTRLQQLQSQMNAVQLELDAKTRELSDINEEKRINEQGLDAQYDEKMSAQKTLSDLKQKISDFDVHFVTKKSELQQLEKQSATLTQNLQQIKKDVTKKSDELLADKTVELQAVQSQLDRARDEMIEMNRRNLQKQQKHSFLEQQVTSTQAELDAKQARLRELENEMQKHDLECGAVQAKIALARNELAQIETQIATNQKQRDTLLAQSRRNIEHETADLEQTLVQKQTLLQEYNTKCAQVQQSIKDKQVRLNVVEETIKKRAADHEKLESEIRQTSFSALRQKSENLTKIVSETQTKESELTQLQQSIATSQEQYHALTRQCHAKQTECDELDQQLHALKTEIGVKKREFESLDLQRTQQQAQLSQIEHELLNLTPQKQSLLRVSEQMKEKQKTFSAMELKFETLQTELELVASNITGSKIQYETINAELRTLTKLRDEANSSLKTTQKEFQNTKQELETIKLDLALQSDTLCATKSDRLTSVMSELKKKSKELNETKKQLRSTKNLLLSKESELKELNGKIETQRALWLQVSADYNGVQQKLKKQRSELRVASMQLHRQQTSQNSSPSSSSPFRSTNDPQQFLSELADAIQSNKQKLTQIEDEVLEKQTKLETVKLHIEQYWNEWSTLKSDMAYLREQKLSKTQEIDELDAEMETKRGELDKVTVEIELKAQAIDTASVVQQRQLMDRIEQRQHELSELDAQCQHKNVQLSSIDARLAQNEQKLSTLSSQLKQIQTHKTEETQQLQSIRETLQASNTDVREKQQQLQQLERDLDCKLKQLHDVNSEFDEQTQQVRSSRNSLQQITVDIDAKNSELSTITQRILNAKTQIETVSIRSSHSGSGSGVGGDGMNLSLLSNISSPEQARASCVAFDAQKTEIVMCPLDVSLEEINATQQQAMPVIGGGGNGDNSDVQDMSVMQATSSPQIVIRTVEKLRRTIDAMCYPRGGCIFSLASILQHYATMLQALQQKRVQLVNVLQQQQHGGAGGGDKNNETNLTSFTLHSEEDDDDLHVQSVQTHELECDESKHEVLAADTHTRGGGDGGGGDDDEEQHKQQQDEAVQDLSTLWQELQTVKKVMKKLNVERQHLQSTLRHALSVIQPPNEPPQPAAVVDGANKKLFASSTSFSSLSSAADSEHVEPKPKPKKSDSTVLQRNEIEAQITRVLHSIGSQGNVWKNTLDAMEQRLRAYECNLQHLQHAQTSAADADVAHKKQELQHVSQQLNAQRMLLRQLRQQSDAIADTLAMGESFQMQSSPTLARQIANKMRLEKQLRDLKQELSDKKQELTLITRQLNEQASELQQQHSTLLASISAATTTTMQQNEQLMSPASASVSQSQVLHRRIEEIQRLYKLREKHLKKRIDSYKKELKKRDSELDDVETLMAQSQSRKKHENGDDDDDDDEAGKLQSLKQYSKQVLKELRTLHVERSKNIHRKDLKNQIKERDEQIAFLITHFGQQKEQQQQQPEMHELHRSHSADDAVDSSMQMSTPSRSETLSRIEANLKDALAPFKSPEHMQRYLSTAVMQDDSENEIGTRDRDRERRNNVRNTAADSHSLLQSIFGTDESAHLRGSTQRTEKTKQKRYQRHTQSSKQKRKTQNVFDNGNDEEVDEEDEERLFAEHKEREDDRSNFILDDHEERYKTLDRKYG